jgi:CBS domain-containing protein
MDGFRKIYTNNITGIPVVDKDGKLIANLSASDIR